MMVQHPALVCNIKHYFPQAVSASVVLWLLIISEQLMYCNHNQIQWIVCVNVSYVQLLVVFLCDFELPAYVHV